jgi:hypothetical protein
VKKFIYCFVIVSLIIVGLTKVKDPVLVHPYIWYTQIFFFSIFFISNRIISVEEISGANKIHIFYLVSLTIRFFLSTVYVIVGLLNTDFHPVVFALNFFVLYLCYTWFEIYSLLSNLRADFKNNEKSE